MRTCRAQCPINMASGRAWRCRWSRWLSIRRYSRSCRCSRRRWVLQWMACRHQTCIRRHHTHIDAWSGMLTWQMTYEETETCMEIEWTEYSCDNLHYQWRNRLCLMSSCLDNCLCRLGSANIVSVQAVSTHVGTSQQDRLVDQAHPQHRHLSSAAHQPLLSVQPAPASCAPNRSQAQAAHLTLPVLH